LLHIKTLKKVHVSHFIVGWFMVNDATFKKNSGILLAVSFTG
jgi:hypothetical protein